MFEGTTVFRIPDNKRDDYFSFVEKFKCSVKNVNDDNWNAYNDPLVIIDFSCFTLQQCQWITVFMNIIGAKNVTNAINCD